MKTFHRATALGLAAIFFGLAGCVIAPARDGYRYDHGYRYEHGDRIDRRGYREERWCEHHSDDHHCHD